MKKVFKNKKVMLSLLTLALCMPLAACGEEQTSSTPESVPPSDTVTSEDLSYLTDFIEQRDDVYEASWKSVGTLDGVLSLERFGFKRLDFTPSEEEIIDLFTIDGRIKRFKDSKYYSKYLSSELKTLIYMLSILG